VLPYPALKGGASHGRTGEEDFQRAMAEPIQPCHCSLTIEYGTPYVNEAWDRK
jgi:hypothetical protein